MLASPPLRLSLVSRLMGVGLILSLISTCDLTIAQQLPSSRYEPTAGQDSSSHRTWNGFRNRNNTQQTAPPSVHIPPSDARDLPSSVAVRFSDDSANRNQIGNPASSLHSSRHSQNVNMNPQQGTIRQTSHVTPVSGPQDLTVPEILQRQSTAAEEINRGLLKQGSSGSPADFGAQMNQVRASEQGIRVSPDEIDSAGRIRREIEEIKSKLAERNSLGSTRLPGEHQQTVPPAANPTAINPTGDQFAVPQQSETDAVTGFSQQLPESEVPASQFSEFAPDKFSSAAPEGMGESLRSLPPAQPTTLISTGRESHESFSDFLQGKEDSLDAAPSGSTSEQMVRPATMEVDDEVPAEQRVAPDTGNAPNRQASTSGVKLAAPAISVESFGPQRIGINQPSEYQVVVKNESQASAERVLVMIDFPVWLEIDRVNMTTGERESISEKNINRLVWKIDRIPGNQSQTITVTAIPRKAEEFDLGIEWTLAPRAGTARVMVTEPKLEMSIVGPEEVQFGDTAAYQVSVRNAGSGDAENVVVMLSEALNGERGTLGDIPAGTTKTFTVNLFARTPGALELAVNAIADNSIEIAASRDLIIRRANLNIDITGPNLRYAGTTGNYLITVSNSGDLRAEEVVAALGLPKGVKFMAGIDSYTAIDGGIRWNIGFLEPGQSREYKIQCQLNAAGDVQLEVGTQGKGALQASHAMLTQVQTIADLAMNVNDPPGPLSTGDEVKYEIVVQNRGTKTASNIDVFMILSQGLEPKSASGLEYRIPRDGAVQFATIPQLEPGQKIVLEVSAIAFKPGTHVYRAHLVCEDADAREIKEGTSRFVGEELSNPQTTSTANRSTPAPSDTPPGQRISENDFQGGSINR